MRILMLCADWGLPYHGSAGSSVHLRSMAKAFRDLGHETRVLAAVAGDGETAGLDRVPVRLWRAAMRETVESLRGAARRPIAAPAEAASSRSDRNTSENSAGSTKASTGSAAAETPSLMTRLYYDVLPRRLDALEELAFYRRRFSRAALRLVDEFKPDFVYERYALGQTGGLDAARRRNLPFLLEVNASLVKERLASTGLSQPLRTLLERDESRLWRSAGRLFCVSGRLKEEALARGARESRVQVLPNGVDADLFAPDRGDGTLRRMAGENRVLVGWIGSLSPGRGARRFLRLLGPLLAEVGEAAGVIIGDGPLRSELEVSSRAAGLEGRIFFTGAVPHERAPSLLADLDVAAAPYPPRRDFYFSPMKLFEYMACGLPTVAGDMGQMSEVIENGVTGLLVRPDDDAAWVEALARLCRSPELRREMGAAARDRTAAGRSWSGNARTVVEAAGRLAREEAA